PSTPPPSYTLSLHDALPISRFTTIRQVGPVQQPPLMEPAGSHNPLPITSWWACVVRVLKPLALRSSTALTRSVGSDMMFPDQMPDRKSTRLNSSHDQISYAV